MIKEYKPYPICNTHTVRVTFNHEGHIGHIAYEMGGNCKGLDIIKTAEDFFADCTSEDIEKMTENDCGFNFDDDSETFEISLSNDEEEVSFDCLTEDGIKKMVVAVAIQKCMKEDM